LDSEDELRDTDIAERVTDWYSSIQSGIKDAGGT
jgi:hypothetical protein